MKTKTFDDIQEYIVRALDLFEKDRDGDIDQSLNQAFIALKLQSLRENRIRNLESYQEQLHGKILEHKTAIQNLRAYLAFVEKENAELRNQIEHDD